MSDNYDDLIGQALGEFRADEAVSAGPITASHTIRATVAHRRKVRLTTLSVIGALAIALPIAAFAAGPRGNNSPPDTPATQGPVVAESVSPSPSVAPPATPKNASVTEQQLIAANLRPWGSDRSCKTAIAAKPKQFKEYAVHVEKLVNTNLDGDADIETAAYLRCDHIEGYYWKVVAYELGADGKPATLGEIIKESNSKVDVIDIAARAEGGITADLSLSYGDPDRRDPANQKRAYAWENGQFRQVSGPTSWPAEEKVDLRLTVTDLQLNGGRTGTVTITVKNLSSTKSGEFWVDLDRESVTAETNKIASISPLSWVGGDGKGGVKSHAALKPGETATLTVTVTLVDGVTPTSIKAGIYQSEVGDPNPANNTVNYRVIP